MKDKAISQPSTDVSSSHDENDAELRLRDRYLLEVQQIKNEIGDLPKILNTLGINQRRACQLLLVDPSAWTRWNKTGAPPHIYQALRWLIQLKEINPNVVGPRDLATRMDSLQHITQKKIEELEHGLSMIERAVAVTPAPLHTLDVSSGRIAVLEEKVRQLLAQQTDLAAARSPKVKKARTTRSSKTRQKKKSTKKAKSTTRPAKKTKRRVATKKRRPLKMKKSKGSKRQKRVQRRKK